MTKIEPMVASFCPKCKMGWYYPIDMSDDEKKQICGYKGCDGKVIHTKMLNIECAYIYCISEDREFLKEMNNLRNNDIIAYKAKVAEFKAIYKQNHPDEEEDENGLMVKKQPSNQPKCPTCGSTNIEKISAGKKMKGSFFFGIFSSDVRNQMHCKDCGYKW